jgi:hypothetical protein
MTTIFTIISLVSVSVLQTCRSYSVRPDTASFRDNIFAFVIEWSGFVYLAKALFDAPIWN